jgi:hypothetical protein
MSSSRSLSSAALVLLATATTVVLIQACGGSAQAAVAAADTVDPIEGVWDSTVTNKDCSSGAVLRAFKGVSSFQHGGSLIADNSAPVPSRGIGLGSWKVASGRDYTAAFRFMRFNPDGSLAGTQSVVRTLTLSGDGNSITGTIAAQQFDPAGAPTLAICATETGTRLY